MVEHCCGHPPGPSNDGSLAYRASAVEKTWIPMEEKGRRFHMVNRVSHIYSYIYIYIYSYRFILIHIDSYWFILIMIVNIG